VDGAKIQTEQNRVGVGGNITQTTKGDWVGGGWLCGKK
jgi:hypothetical protein